MPGEDRRCNRSVLRAATADARTGQGPSAALPGAGSTANPSVITVDLPEEPAATRQKPAS